MIRSVVENSWLILGRCSGIKILKRAEFVYLIWFDGLSSFKVNLILTRSIRFSRDL